MQDSFFKKVTIASFISALVMAVALLWMGPKWSQGALIGFCWIYLNCFFLFRLIETAFGGKAVQKNTVMVLSILKFPVLYAAGFFILQSRLFPMASILAGLTIFIVVFVVCWIVARPTVVPDRNAS